MRDENANNALAIALRQNVAAALRPGWVHFGLPRTSSAKPFCMLGGARLARALACLVVVGLTLIDMFAYEVQSGTGDDVSVLLGPKG